MAKSNNYKNYIFENIELCCRLLSFNEGTTESTFFSFALNHLIVQTPIVLFADR